MAAFPPDLIPSTRTYSPGEFPHSVHGVYDGSQARVRHSNTVLGVRLRLFFPAITTAELLTVITHYNGQRGRFLPFAIPDDLLSGTSTPADFTPAGHTWRYAAKPTVEDISVDGPTPSNLHNLTVELETVPPENTIAPGLRLRTRTEFRPGSAQLGASFDVYTIFQPGAAASVASGLALTVTTTFVPGAATGDSGFDPLTLSPVAWWDASDASTITISGGKIQTWADKSGNGLTLSEVNVINPRPDYTTAAMNGLNAARWPAGDNGIALATASAAFAIQEMYVVLQYNGSAFTNFDGILGAFNNTWYISGNNVGTALQSGTFDGAFINGNNGTNRFSNVFTEIQSPCLLRVKNTTAYSSTTRVGFGMDRNLVSLGRGWSGYIGEMLVFDTLLPSGDRTDLETFLMDKWGI